MQKNLGRRRAKRGRYLHARRQRSLLRHLLANTWPAFLLRKDQAQLEWHVWQHRSPSDHQMEIPTGLLHLHGTTTGLILATTTSQFSDLCLTISTKWSQDISMLNVIIQTFHHHIIYYADLKFHNLQQACFSFYSGIDLINIAFRLRSIDIALIFIHLADMIDRWTYCCLPFLFEKCGDYHP